MTQDQPCRGRLTSYGSARYLIRVAGTLGASWSDHFGGMRISESIGGEQVSTELVGAVPDQAALLGILSGLYDLNLPLLLVERISE